MKCLIGFPATVKRLTLNDLEMEFLRVTACSVLRILAIVEASVCASIILYDCVKTVQDRITKL